MFYPKSLWNQLTFALVFLEEKSDASQESI